MSEPKPLKLINARIIDPAYGLDTHGSVVIIDGHITAIGQEATTIPLPEGGHSIDCRGAIVAPGLIDMRVFTGEPGAEHRETLTTASQAAAAGGVTTFAMMPDTDPVIDDVALVDFIFRRARDTGIVRVKPTAALTKGLDGLHMTEMGLLKEAGAVAFTDGRKSIANAQIMRRAMTYARTFDALIMHQPEDPDLAGMGVMNESETATRLGLIGIPREAETIMLARDLKLARLTGARYHAAQISTIESVEQIRRAKAENIAVSAAVSINHLTLNENDIGDYRTFFKLSPPLRGEDDRQALIAGLVDGTIDAIVSNHDPQDVETKRHPFAEAANGAIGLETMLPVALRLVHAGHISLLRLFEAISTAPASLLGIQGGSLAIGSEADIVIFQTDEPWILDADTLSSRSKNTSFEDAKLQGRIYYTIVAGRLVYDYASAS